MIVLSIHKPDGTNKVLPFNDVYKLSSWIKSNAALASNVDTQETLIYSRNELCTVHNLPDSNPASKRQVKDGVKVEPIHRLGKRSPKRKYNTVRNKDLRNIESYKQSTYGNPNHMGQEISGREVVTPPDVLAKHKLAKFKASIEVDDTVIEGYDYREKRRLDTHNRALADARRKKEKFNRRQADRAKSEEFRQDASIEI